MSNEELESQLSTMFDDELPRGECELLARRLSRDSALKERWGRYALIAATMRGERGLPLDASVARRVAVVLATEPALTQDARGAAIHRPARLARWRQAIAGGAVAAGVAAVSILWLRAQELPDDTLAAQSGGSVPPAAIVTSTEPDSYTVPTVIDSPAMIPTAELANYVVAHSEFSGPLVRRNTLSTLVASDAGVADLAEVEPESAGSADAPPR
ncbi:MAG: sigma-E factor negative regulatory protein [Longimicrobiales bacterium]